ALRRRSRPPQLGLAPGGTGLKPKSPGGKRAPQGKRLGGVGVPVFRAAARPPSHCLTGTAFGREPAVLTGRRGGPGEFLGRGAVTLRSRSSRKGSPADPWRSVGCSLRADADLRKPSGAVVGAAVNPVPVVTTLEGEILPRARCAY